MGRLSFRHRISQKATAISETPNGVNHRNCPVGKPINCYRVQRRFLGAILRHRAEPGRRISPPAYGSALVPDRTFAAPLHLHQACVFMDSPLFLGIDVGSTTLKAVLLAVDGKILHHLYRRMQSQFPADFVCAGSCRVCGRCNLGAVAKTLNDFLAQSGVSRNQVAHTVVTGSQVVDDLSRFLPFDTFVSEVSAHIAAASHYYPDCQAVLDVGGQDSKAMSFDDTMEIWVAKMSGICAEGTGAFLDSVAAKLNVPVEKLADHVNYDSTPELSSVCAVLSATSVNKFKNRYPLGDVIAAACRAQARTIVSGVGDLFLNYEGAIVFQGRVASNHAVAHYLPRSLATASSFRNLIK